MPVITSKHFRWIEVENYAEMSRLAAAIFEQQLLEKPDSVLGLATGGSPVGFYEALVKQFQQGGFTFKDAQSFNLDEYVGISPIDSTSYHSYMERHLFSHIDLPLESRNLPDGMAENIPAECDHYEQAIVQSGGIDLQLLGIGVNGHIGFNEPGTSFQSKTHVVELADETREENAKYFSSKEDVPKHAITMGISTIMKAKKIVLLAFGEHKLEAIKRLRFEGISEDFPASILKEHPHVTVLYGK
ncbi:glucosamine-6-phosphate deaminase [Paenisporosarcina quisquiliarum]|uniref:Glucosamine-6-phosphate deaminase n=1 Tax=Paenisporosarcina quisquiliarum TaxID=365346 RepID=A0A9X3LGC6_9BACL|nr:glucosamine-6-phosphate deaminase [Paenisporosarcina quisquiliarum]MCZ8537371.1 glucosamine-6-phosphate deaminase [Paenisporosarcina quisquiliarum]